jgi:hypothetical protein
MLWLASAIADRTDEADLGGRDGIHVVGTQRARDCASRQSCMHNQGRRGIVYCRLMVLAGEQQQVKAEGNI